MKVKLETDIHGDLKLLTENDEPLSNIYVLSKKRVKDRVNRLRLEVVYIEQTPQKINFHSPLEGMAKPKRARE